MEYHKSNTIGKQHNTYYEISEVYLTGNKIHLCYLENYSISSYKTSKYGSVAKCTFKNFKLKFTLFIKML